MRYLYYRLKPLLPRSMQIVARRAWVGHLRRLNGDRWPVNPTVGGRPEEFPSWPQGARFAVVLTHDVESCRWKNRCAPLAEIEQSEGFRSCFNFVPSRCREVAPALAELRSMGCEIGVHGWNHDGLLFTSREVFMSRAARINRAVRAWGATGFRAPSMHHNLEWIPNLDITYDASTFDFDPFQPQPDGVGSLFPFVLPRSGRRGPIVELPTTLPQDFDLFVLLRERTIDVWKRKIEWIAERGGMVLVNTHPDYMSFSARRRRFEEYPVRRYSGLLQFLNRRFSGEFWNPLPREMASFVLANDRSPSGGFGVVR